MAIDGTDVEETMPLAAEFNSSFGNLVRASVGPESVVDQEDLNLLGGSASTQQAASKNDQLEGGNGKPEEIFSLHQVVSRK